MKRNLRPRGPRIGRSKRGQQDFKSDSLRNSAFDIDTSEGLTGLFHQVSQVVCKPSLNSSKSKEICLSLINNTVNYVKETSKKSESKNINTRIAVTERNSNDLALENYTQKFKEDWNDIKTKEKYYCLFRCILLHKRKEVRAAGLRLLRYITKTEDDVKCLIRSNSIPLIVRCIDICIDNHCERLHGIRLARHILFVAPQEFQNGLARSLIAIAKDGSRDRDKLLRSAQAIVNELAILNPQVFVECGGVSSTLYGILDCPYPRVNEALMGSLLFLLNDPNWRTSCSQFHMIMAPFSDIHYRHHEYDLEYSKNEEREMRVQASCYAILAAIRSWPGFITLYQPQDRTLQSLIDLLRLPSESTRNVILDFLYDLFRIPMGPSHDDYDKALAERSVVKPLDPDAWKLHEGFVVAEAKVLLPHIAKFRPNLIQNYFSLILYTLIKKGLLSSLCEVVITSSQSLSIKATILIGELLHKVDQNLPDCGLMFHALPLLSEKAAGADGEQRLRASQAITALLQLSRIRLKCSHVKGMSLYLSGILESSKNETSKSRGSWEPASCSKWLGKDHDDLIQQTLKSSALFTKCPSTDWKWNLIVPVLRWPSSSLLSLEDSTYRSFIEKLVQYFKPSSKLFSRVECTHHSALIQADALVAFVEFLLEVSEEDQEKFLSNFLRDLTSSLKEVACERPFHDAYFSPSHMSITVCQYYFLAIGRLTSHSKGYSHVLKAGVYDQMLVVISESRSDVYAKLFASTLDYTINGLNRTILSKILTHKKDGNRMYATQFLRVLVRCHAKDFTKWGIELLVGQLDDPSKLVALTALDILDEAMDHEEYLEAVLKNPPSVKHLGDNGQLLLAKLVGSPQGFKTYHECNLIHSLLDKWATVFNLK
ncbi:Rapamycin-insensitive companion of mTOR [Armadillidium nasatum]|uniref:Rapamycin-insensitive companion of mTOR n=1 Tax=Armadillidium nasatum TaxID=96803 RepID=A0A5N5SKP9_9CRUS|nr:Rapamycin-insensitive companion of mTOR [Armadillidium nasatum]